ncbi:ISSpo7, transposase [Salipiger bermudensis HTCC2601]|uniref:ISSpo7, transposase n=1 Tax=Salipiger bermudensis (strain DSM 26914 / JCM 13377 / KCTC 12554 / HTCC2601) TaxID=314265 RepID=Q0FLZ3_SALBH|nr:ISSpo7, transposase [Salipiger bermudensis HTCC2601]EAU45871.1 ISSpo7, transposase [Salipiger bermudensis HTCC2601]
MHAICDSNGRPISFFVSAGQVSDYIGARALLSSLPDVDWLLGDRGYDADWFREALQDKGIRACIPGRKQRKTTVKYPLDGVDAPSRHRCAKVAVSKFATRRKRPWRRLAL